MRRLLKAYRVRLGYDFLNSAARGLMASALAVASSFSPEIRAVMMAVVPSAERTPGACSGIASASSYGSTTRGNLLAGSA